MTEGSGMVESSADDAPAAPRIHHEGSEIGMVGSNNSGEEDKGRVDELCERSLFGGNRWPRQETLALLKIRSDMDAVFRDSSLKGPLWEEISRKLAELGYHRSAKKCKEKFENVYKYHKRTKDGRTGKKSYGKTYRFFDQIQAFENLHCLQSLNSPPKPQTPTPVSASAAMPWSITSSNPLPPNSNIVTPSINPIVSTQAVLPTHSINPYFRNVSSNYLFSISTSSYSTASDVDDISDHRGIRGGKNKKKKKRKWKEFFKRLTKEVIEKQEELQNKFLQTIERYELERTAREDAWRVQEMARVNREHEILVQERSAAAAKDAALIAWLQKISGVQQPNTTPVQENNIPQPPPPTAVLSPPIQALNFGTTKISNGGNNDNNNVVSSSPSRWPKDEIEALIRIRTGLEIKYQENGPKAPLWEDISVEMRKLGYNRNAKRCKEKWENINKYFKKVKESSKKRPEDSKTCPYFHQLDAIYKEKISKNLPLMVRPEQQWPPLLPQQEITGGKQNSDHAEVVRENEDRVIQDDEEDGYSTGDEYDDIENFELVANKTATIGSGE